MKLSGSPLCEICKQSGRLIQADHVDHIQSIESGGEAYDLNNLMSLCAPCHSRKTVLKDGGFGRAPSDESVIKGCSVDGIPLDPQHPWNQAAAK